jgi:hypothetical protein
MYSGDMKMNTTLHVIFLSEILLMIMWIVSSGLNFSPNSRDENGADIFRPYSRPNPFRGVLIRPYPSLDI